jgi:hypothetical protein
MIALITVDYGASLLNSLNSECAVTGNESVASNLLAAQVRSMGVAGTSPSGGQAQLAAPLAGLSPWSLDISRKASRYTIGTMPE